MADTDKTDRSPHGEVPGAGDAGPGGQGYRVRIYRGRHGPYPDGPILVAAAQLIVIDENGGPCAYDPCDPDRIPIANDGPFPITIQAENVTVDVPPGCVRAISPDRPGPVRVRTVVTQTWTDGTTTPPQTITKTITAGPFALNDPSDGVPPGTPRRFDGDGMLGACPA